MPHRALFILGALAHVRLVTAGLYGLTKDWKRPGSIDVEPGDVDVWWREAKWVWCRSDCSIATFVRDQKFYDLYVTSEREMAHGPDAVEDDEPNEHMYHFIEVAPRLVKSMDEMAKSVPDEGNVIEDVIEHGWGIGFEPEKYIKLVNAERERRRRRK